jgi:MFS family permease
MYTARFQLMKLSYKWRVVLMLWCISTFNYADRQAIFSVFPLLQKEMHLDPVQLGLLGSAFAWIYGLAAPLAGAVVDRVRRKTAILGGLQAWSVICIATAASRSFAHLLLFRASEGLGETIYLPASVSMISDYHGKQTRSRALGVHQTSVYMGTVAGGFFAGLIGQHYGWRWSSIVFGGLGILLGIGLRKFLIEPDRGAADDREGWPVKQAGGFAALRVFWATPTALLLMAAFLCANFVALVLLSWMPMFLYEKFHLSLAMAGLTATLFAQVASMAASPVGGWAADVLRRTHPGGRLMVQTAGVLLGAPFVALCAMTRSAVWLVVALTAWGFFKGIYDANIWASLFDVVRPEIRGTAAGLMNMIGWLGGGGAAPLAVGYLARNSSLSTAIALTSVVYLAAAAFLLIAIVGFVNRDVERLDAGPGSKGTRVGL